MSTNNLTNKISDLKKLSDEKKTTGRPQPPRSPSRATSASNMERPASRHEIFSLEKELEEKVRLVLESSNFLRTTDEFGVDFSYQPHKETVINFREKLLTELQASVGDVEEEPWLDSFLKCECLKSICDDISSKFSDIVGVSSTEMGSVSRKLRLTYKQSFEQMAGSWKTLRVMLKQHDNEVKRLTTKVEELEEAVHTKEAEVISRFDDDIARLHAEFAQEKAREHDKLLAAEFKMEQMSETLKYLNGIFRTMQNDGSTLKTTDLQTALSRLEKENRELKATNREFDAIKMQLAQTQQQLRQLEGQHVLLEDEAAKLRLQLHRRDEVIASLMEKDAVRSAEIEKLQKMAKLKDDELLSMDMKDPATSVLCIKCKRSLDDLTNIKAALVGGGGSGGGGGGSGNDAPLQRLQCEPYRILLPNLKQRKPSRPVPWLRTVMRSLLCSAMRQHLNWQTLKPETIRFPALVYSWFHRSQAVQQVSGTMLTKLLVQCDEERWALYYGVKGLGKDDPEAALFYALLDENYGQDGLHFLVHCLGSALSLGGPSLWAQLGSVLYSGNSVEDAPFAEEPRPTIWLDLAAAKQATTLLLQRALTIHVHAALDALEALKAKPPRDATVTFTVDGEEATVAQPKTSTEATHINLFIFLRILQQQLHADKIHRAAAIRLMFETASVGALTPAAGNSSTGEGGAPGGATQPHANTTGGNNNNNNNNLHVEFPQFLSICRTLFPTSTSPASAAASASTTPSGVSLAECAALYAVCHQQGRRRVDAATFTVEADRRGWFSKVLMLPALPLLKHWQPASPVANAINTTASVTTAVVEVGGGETGGVENAGGAFTTGNGTNPSTSQVVRTSTVPFTSLSTSLAAAVAQHNAAYPQPLKHTVRSQLATMIHRKLAAIKPLLVEIVLPRLPDMWSATLREALQHVQQTLDDSFLQLQAERKQQEQQQAADENAQNSTSKGTFASILSNSATSSSTATAASSSTVESAFIDGVQPYQSYRRLLSLVSLAVVVNDNPLLPADLFTVHEFHTSRRGGDHGVRSVLKRAEAILSHLEDSVCLPLDSALQAQQKLFLQHQQQLQKTTGGSTTTTVTPGASATASGASAHNVVTTTTKTPTARNKEANASMYQLQQLTRPAPTLAPNLSLAHRLIARTHRFEHIRRVLILRRLQLLVRRFISPDVAVPRSLRRELSPGYLAAGSVPYLPSSQPSSTSNATPANTGKSGTAVTPAGNTTGGGGHAIPPHGIRMGKLLGLRHRDLYLEPWHLLSSISCVYLHKLDHDARALRLNTPPLTLSQAVLSYAQSLTGVTVVAERWVQDLCNGIRAYRHACTRMRLFSYFLGDVRDAPTLFPTSSATGSTGSMYNNSHAGASSSGSGSKATGAGAMLLNGLPIHDERVQEQLLGSVLAHPCTFAVYAQLLHRVHTAVQAHMPSGSNDTNTGSVSGAGTGKTQGVVIDTLFPASENPLSGNSGGSNYKRDVWLVDGDILLEVVRAWTQTQTRHWPQTTPSSGTSASANANSNNGNSSGGAGAGVNANVYVDLVEKLLRPAAGVTSSSITASSSSALSVGKVDVDDVLYLLMVQYAKLQVWQITRVWQRAQQLALSSSTGASASSPTAAKTPAHSAANQSAGLSGEEDSSDAVQRAQYQLQRLGTWPLPAWTSLVETVYAQRGTYETGLLPSNTLSTSNHLPNANASSANAGSNSNINGATGMQMLPLSDFAHFAAVYVKSVLGARRICTLLPSSTASTNAKSANPTGANGTAMVVTSARSHSQAQHALALVSTLRRQEQRLTAQLTRFLFDAVVWDTSLVCCVTPLRLHWRQQQSPSANITDATTSATNQSATTRSGLSSRPISSSRSTTVHPRPSSSSGTSTTSRAFHSDEYSLLDAHILEACAPELLFAAQRHAYTAYQQVCHSFLATALAAASGVEATESANNNSSSSNNSNSANVNNASMQNLTINTANNAHNSSASNMTGGAGGGVVSAVRQKVQTLRSQLLALADFFSVHDGAFVSDRLLNLQLLGATEEDLADLKQQKQVHRLRAREAQQLMRALLSGIAEVAALTQLDFPRDPWQGGVKLHLDRAFVYSLHLRSGLV